MKRIAAVVLAAIILLLCGCSNKVDEAQKSIEEARQMLNEGSYQMAIKVTNEILNSEEDELDSEDGKEVIFHAKEVKALALYGLQKERYDEKNWSSSASYYQQIADVGVDQSMLNKSYKLYVAAQVETLFEQANSSIQSKSWMTADESISQIIELSESDSLDYGENDEINKRVEEIVEECQSYYPELREKAEIQKEEDRIRRSNEAHNNAGKGGIIRVDSIYTSSPDYADGVDVEIHFTVNQDKTIKYITFGFEFYNAVNDVVDCEIRREGSPYFEYFTGPFEPDESYTVTTEKYYNADIKRTELVGVIIEYMDGSVSYVEEK